MSGVMPGSGQIRDRRCHPGQPKKTAGKEQTIFCGGANGHAAELHTFWMVLVTVDRWAKRSSGSQVPPTEGIIVCSAQGVWTDAGAEGVPFGEDDSKIYSLCRLNAAVIPVNNFPQNLERMRMPFYRSQNHGCG